MLTKISNWFYKVAKVKWILSILLAFISCILLYPVIYIIYPNAIDFVSLDDLTFYNLQETYLILKSWGNEGRALELWFHLIWDTIVPILYSLFFALLISWFFQRGFNPTSKLYRLNAIAILGGFFDIMENVCIEIMIAFYPTQLISIFWLKTVFTMSKYIFGVVLIFFILIGLVKVIMVGLKHQEDPVSKKNNINTDDI